MYHGVMKYSTRGTDNKPRFKRTLVVSRDSFVGGYSSAACTLLLARVVTSPESE